MGVQQPYHQYNKAEANCNMIGIDVSTKAFIDPEHLAETMSAGSPKDLGKFLGALSVELMRQGDCVREDNIKSATRSVRREHRNTVLNVMRSIVHTMTGSKSRVAELPSVILGYVCDEFGFTRSQIIGASRVGDLPLARSLCVILLTMYTGMTLREIAEVIGRQDHATVINARTTGYSRISSEKQVRNRFESVCQAVSGYIQELP